MAPMYEDDELPWEKRGRTRLDLEPHRGGLIAQLGGVSLVCGLASFCLGFPGLVGLPLGLTALVMAHRDIEKMRQGQMDRRGQGKTRRGGDMGLVGALLSLLGFLVAAAVVADRLLPPPYGTGNGF